MKKRILWCSDTPEISTGYTNQSLYILRHLSQRQECAILGHQHNGIPRQANSSYGMEPFMLYPGNYDGQSITAVINHWKPQLVAWLCDAFSVEWIPKKKNEWMNVSPKTLFYFPVDSDDIYLGMDDVLGSVDYRVAMSWFAHNKLKKETGLDSFVIPHCVDTNIFYPLVQENKDNIRKELGLEGKFVIGMVGRNQSRKNPQRLLYILKIFFENHKDAYALFHCDPNDPMSASGKVSMTLHALQLGLNDHNPPRKDCDKCRLRFTGFNFQNQAPPNIMNNIYNSFDVHALTTTGEGFGITTLEAMSCGIPNVLTDYTTTQELIVDNGRCGEPVAWKDFLNGGYTTKRVLPDIDTFVAKLEKLYNKLELRKEYGEVARQKVLRYYSLNNVLPQWQQLVSEILDKEEILCQI